MNGYPLTYAQCVEQLKATNGKAYEIVVNGTKWPNEWSEEFYSLTHDEAVAIARDMWSSYKDEGVWSVDIYECWYNSQNEELESADHGEEIANPSAEEDEDYVQIDGIKFSLADLKNAEWEEDESVVTYGYDITEDGSLSVTRTSENGLWYSITTEHVKDVNGKDYSICMMETENGSVIEIGPAEDGPAYPENNSLGKEIIYEGWKINPIELAQKIGYELSYDDTIDESDYVDVAKNYVEENPDVVYYIDEEKGFANEWTLYVVDNATDPEADWVKCTDPVYYIARAMMSNKDYMDIYGTEKMCGIVIK